MALAYKEELRAEIERLQEHRHKQMEDIITLGQMVGKLEVENKKLRAALKEYGRHQVGCQSNYWEMECNCGLSGAPYNQRKGRND